MACTCLAAAAPPPADWQFVQEFEVQAPGLVRASLPLISLDRSRPRLEDLRLYDPSGREVPFVIDRPRPSGKTSQRANRFDAVLDSAATVITVETGLTQPIDAVTLESPASSFIKAVEIAGSVDRKTWQTLARGQPIFRQPSGASRMQVQFSAGAWRWLRLTVDDQRSMAIPFSGAFVHAASGTTVPSEEVQLRITERHENPGETRLTVDLGAANIELAAVRLETAEPLFTRQVTVAVPQVEEDAIREETIAQQTIFRVALEGQAASTNLTIPIERQVPARELILSIRNLDSPPLVISAARAQRWPVFLVFHASQAGRYQLATGNPGCPAPRYDLAALEAHLKLPAAQDLAFLPMAANPTYRPPDALQGIEIQGASLDVKPWRCSKPIRPARAGVQQLELDLEVLSHAASGFGDLRLLRETKQVPYILERTSIRRMLTPAVTVTNDINEPKVSRWILTSPMPSLPIQRLSCTARTRVFERNVVLYEELSDDRGERYRRRLGSATWLQTPERTNRELTIALEATPRGNALFLETANGDNPPVDLADFRLFYPVTRLLFQAATGEELQLYYGNSEVSSPQYDLSLVAGRLLAAEKVPAELGKETQLRKSSWQETRVPGKGGIVFWGVLALVVVGLLVVISRLLPRTPPA